MKQNKAIALLCAVVIAFGLTACQNNNDELIKQKDNEITSLKAQIKGLNDTVAELNKSIEDNEALLMGKESELAQINEALVVQKDQEAELMQIISELESQLNQPSSLLISAMTAVMLLDQKDMDALSLLVHPVKGVLFSPYSFVHINDDIVFTPAELVDAPGSSNIYIWGDYDGIGDPISLGFDDYYDRFVYDKPFAFPHLIGNNTNISSGNTIVNIEDVFPDGEFVEFHFTGFDPEFVGMDWKSLRLVFEFYQGEWYLVAIVHDEWTI